MVKRKKECARLSKKKVCVDWERTKDLPITYPHDAYAEKRNEIRYAFFDALDCFGKEDGVMMDVQAPCGIAQATQQKLVV